MADRSPWKIWTDEMDARMLELCGTGVRPDQWPVIAESFPGRSPLSCRQHWFLLRQKAKGIPMKKRGPRQSRAKDSLRPRPVRSDAVMQAPPARLPTHRSITALLCGDPLPGRSALDEKVNALRTSEYPSRLNQPYSFSEPVASLHPLSRVAASASKATPARDADAFLSGRAP